MRLWIGGQLLVDSATDPDETAYFASIALQAEQYYRVKLEYSDDLSAASIDLIWESASTEYDVVPEDRLLTGLEECLPFPGGEPTTGDMCYYEPPTPTPTPTATQTPVSATCIASIYDPLLPPYERVNVRTVALCARMDETTSVSGLG